MAKKTGAGGRPQDFNEQNGQYTGEGTTYRQNTPYEEILETDISKSKWWNDLTPRGHCSVELNNEQNAYDFVSRELGVSREKAEEYVKSIRLFTGPLFKRIRAYQQGEHVNYPIETARLSNAIEEYIKRAPRWNGGETFRGIGLSPQEAEKYKVGYEFKGMQGTASWSTDLGTAGDFADKNGNRAGIAVIFHSPTQSKGTSISHLSRYGTEKEVIVSKDAGYRVVRAGDIAGRKHIWLEEI